MKKFLLSSMVICVFLFCHLFGDLIGHLPKRRGDPPLRWALISVYAEEKSFEGSFTRIVGEVKIKNASSTEWVSAEENMLVSRGDRIKTETGSEAEITFDEGTIIRLEPESSITINESILEEKTQLKKLVVKVNNGRVLSNLEKFTHPKSKFEIQGPGGIVAAVRGTEFVFEVSKDETVEVAVFGGMVGVKNEKISAEKEIFVSEEKETVVKPDKEPLEPRNLTEKFLKYRAEKIKAFHQRVAENRKRIDQIRQKRMEWIEKKKTKRMEKIEERKRKIDLRLEEKRKKYKRE